MINNNNNKIMINYNDMINNNNKKMINNNKIIK